MGTGATFLGGGGCGNGSGVSGVVPLAVEAVEALVAADCENSVLSFAAPTWHDIGYGVVRSVPFKVLPQRCCSLWVGWGSL